MLRAYEQHHVSHLTGMKMQSRSCIDAPIAPQCPRRGSRAETAAARGRIYTMSVGRLFTEKWSTGAQHVPHFPHASCGLIRTARAAAALR